EAVLAAGPALSHSQPGAAVFVVLRVAVPGESNFHSTVLVAVDFFAGRAGDDGHLRAIHGRLVIAHGAPGFVGRDGGELVVVAGGFTATLFLQGRGLFAGMGNGGEQPFPVQGLAVVVLQGHFGAGGEVGPVAFAFAEGGVVSQGVQLRLGEGLAAGIGFVAAGVVVVLIVFPVVCTADAGFVHQGVGWVFEGVVFDGHGGGFDSLFVGEAEHAGLSGAATGLGVACDRVQFRSVAVVVSENQGRLFFAVHTAVLVAIVPAFFGGQAFNEVEVGFP